MGAVRGLRTLRADNPGPFTLDGTRTRLIGHDDVVVIDPGPDMVDHVRALSHLLTGASRITIALTHGHADHAAAVDALAGRHPGADVAGAGHPSARPLQNGSVLTSDAGDLIVVPTPGHTRDHLAFHWPDRGILFAGDLVLGEGDTTWVAEYPGCVADYLASLDRVEALEVDRVVPAHGPDIEDPKETWDRYRRHRLDRIAAVRDALASMDSPAIDELMERVYGSNVPEDLRPAARASLSALVHHVEGDAERHAEGSDGRAAAEDVDTGSEHG